MFAIIEVEQDYDYVQGLTCLGVRNTYEEAFKYVQERTDKNTKEWQIRNQYIYDYVDKIDLSKWEGSDWDIPRGDRYSKWKDFIKPYFGERWNITPSNFKQELKIALRQRHSMPELDINFQPPKEPEYLLPLHIVEIVV